MSLEQVNVDRNSGKVKCFFRGCAWNKPWLD